MTSSSRSSLVTGPSSLPLFKVSFCTTAGLRSNLVWTHLPQRDNLFAVFDYVTQRGVEGFTTQKRTLKLIRGGDVLEHIELDNLALQARLDEERNISQLLEDADRYVILLVRRPLLAMRYQLPDGRIRRIQLNFQPESGYDAAVSALQGLGLPIRDKNQPAIHSASIAPRPPQSQGYGLPAPQPPRLLPSPEFTYRPSTSNGFEYRPPSSAPKPTSERPVTAPDPVNFSQILPPKRELPPEMRPYISPQKAVAPSAISTSELSRPIVSEHKRTLAGPPTRRRKITPISQRVLIEENAAVHPTSRESNQVELPSYSKPTEVPMQKAGAEVDRQQTKITSSGILRTSSLDHLANDAEPPLLTGHQSADPIELSIKGGAIASAATNINTPTFDSATKATDTSANPSKPERPLVLRPGKQAMAEIAGNTRNLQPDHPEQPTASTTAQEAPSKSISAPCTEEVSPEEFMSSLDKFVREYQHLPAPQPQPTAAEELAAYAAQPDEVREAIIKDMILGFLGDENFIKLAEDVEKEWRRVGLPL